MPRNPVSAPVESHLDAICEHLRGGSSLRSYCAAKGISESAVRSWLSRDEEANAQFVNARAIGCDALAEQIIEIADTPLIGQTVTRKPIVIEGKPVEGAFVEEIKTEDMLGHRRLQIDARLRLIGKWNQQYGDKVAHTGADGGAIKLDVESRVDMSGLDDEQLRALASIRIPAE